MNALRLTLLSLWVVVVACGCGSDGGDSSPDVGGVADVAVSEDVGEVDVVGAPDIVTSEDVQAFDVPAPPEDTGDDRVPSGGIIVWQAESDYLNRANASAGFQWYAEIEPAEVSYGACNIVYADPSSTNAPQSLDAGTITVTGTNPGVTLTFDAAIASGGFGYVSSLDSETVAIHPAAGAAVTASAEGGADLPSFEITAVTPEPVEISAPSSNVMDSIDSDEPLEVAWNAATAHSVVVTVSGMSAGFQTLAGDTVVCTLEGDPGAYTVPAEALAHLPSEAARALVSVTRIITVAEPLLAGEVTLAVTASSGVVPVLN